MAGSPARKEVARVGVKVVPDTSDFGNELRRELSRWENEELEIKVEADLDEFEAQLREATRTREMEVRLNLDTAQAEAQLQRFLSNRDLEVNIDLDTAAAQTRLDELTRNLTATINVEVDDAAARAQIQELTQPESKTINVDVDDAAARAQIEVLTRPETKTINIDIDRNSLLNAANVIGSFLDGVVRGLAVVGAAAGVVGSLISNISRDAQTSFQILGNITTNAVGGFNRLGRAALDAGLNIGKIALYAVGIAGVVTLLGSVVTAAGSALLAIGSVVIGAAALFAVPLIFAQVAQNLITTNEGLKRAFKELRGQINEALTKAAIPMIAELYKSLQLVNKAIEEGSPLFNELQIAFGQAAGAITPLTVGMLAFVRNALGGLNKALMDMNASAFWEKIAIGLGILGKAVGDFYAKLGEWAPQISDGFLAIAGAAEKLLPPFADLIGAFSSFAPSVIDTIAEAFKRLFEAFTANRDVYGAAADAFARALRDMAGPLEEVFRAFALMAPEILGAIADAVRRFADTITDPDTIQGLTDLAVAIVDVATKAGELAAQIAAKFGDMTRDVGVGIDRMKGVITDGVDVSIDQLKRLVNEADSTREAATNLQKQLENNIAWIQSAAVRDLQKFVDEWQQVIDDMVEAGDTGSAQVNQTFRDRLQELVTQIMLSGDGINQEWRAKLDQLVKETQNSTDPMVQAMSQMLETILNDTDIKGNQLRDKFVNFLRQMEDQTKASQIAEYMGIELNETATAVGDGVQKAQEQFRTLPEVMQEIINSSKTPEEMERKLSEVSKVVEEGAEKSSKAFAKLPEGMNKTIQSQSATIGASVKRMMDSVSKEISAAKMKSSDIWKSLFSDMATTITSDTQVSSSLNTKMTGMVDIVRTAVLSGGQEWGKLFGKMQELARNDNTSDIILKSMNESISNIKAGVDKGVKHFGTLKTESEKTGKLTEFQKALEQAMKNSETTVKNGVNNIISQLERINSISVSPKISIPSGGGGGGDAGAQSQSVEVAPLSMKSISLQSAEATPMVMATAAAPETASASALQALATFSRTTVGTGSSTQAGAAGAPERVYNIAITAAPNVPTEEQLRRQLSYADALYT